MLPDINSAQVVVRRLWELPGWRWSWTWTVWLDGEEVGELSNGGSLTVLASSGWHEIVVSSPRLGSKSEPFRFHAEAGDRVNLVAQALLLSGHPKVWRRGVPDGQPHLGDLLQQSAAQHRTALRQRNWSAGRRSDMSPPPRPTDVAPPPQVPVTGELIEGSRCEVPLGEETRTVDNSKSSSSSIRVVRLTMEWSKTCVLDTEHNMTVRGSAGLGIRVLTLKAEAERLVKNTYSVTSGERETFTEEVTLNIAQHTKSKIIFFWKEVHQKGIVQISGPGFEARIPYEVVVGLTFDQQQVDIP
jgi:hypothetical protein